ncbi:MAG: hypothetical protein KA174_09230 [Chitinophagales bacterium]|jgi:hypothetical protein|nr:hypothetical protein [Saprospirales bacterium]MBP6660855.1 hypothetical protein [Chitinophagales bacterium]
MNKKILTIAIAICTLFTSVQIGFSKTTASTTATSSSSISIKLKNDTDDEMTVINAGSGGTYRLSKNTVVTIKMDEGDKLFVYEKGKKGAMLLVASSEMDGKVQLVSKL